MTRKYNLFKVQYRSVFIVRPYRVLSIWLHKSFLLLIECQER